MLRNNNYLIGRIGTNKTQVHHRMQLRQFTRRQTLSDIQTTPQERKPDPELSNNHDDLYVIPRANDYETPLFDAGNNNATRPNSIETAVKSDLLTEETWNTPGTSKQVSAKFWPKRRNYVT